MAQGHFSLRAAAAVLVVTITSGLLFAISAKAQRSSAQPSAEPDLVTLVRSTQDDVDALTTQIAGLRKDIDSYAMRSSISHTATLANADVAGRAVSGPGVVVTLNDAPSSIVPEGATPNDLVIHQQDIEDVMNALWSAGAEAISVQGVRITGRSVVRCIGNVILVDGQSFSPPYEIAAIGDPLRLRDEVEKNPRIVNYKAYVALYGLGWNLRVEDQITLPAASTNTVNTYAQPME